MSERAIAHGRAGHAPARRAREEVTARVRVPLLTALLSTLLIWALSASAVLSGAEWEAKARRDPDLAAAKAAVDGERWRDAIAILGRVVERRPWDDDAFTLLGYAYRKAGDVPRSFEHYRRALELNPHHLGALEYLGEAYVETGQPGRARELLDRIEVTCRRTHEGPDWADSCEQWRELAELLESPH